MGLFDKNEDKAKGAPMPSDEVRLKGMKQKYESVFTAAQQHNVRLQNVHFQDNKLVLRGEAPSEDVKNKLWDAIKRINPKMDDIAADFTVSANAAAGQGGPAGGGTAPGRSYTVKAGDTLSKISQDVYGNANDYMKIFNANKGTLTDPDKIKPGQVLAIPGK